MRSQKKTRFFSLGRKWVFTLALFLLVFAAASAVKVQAVSNITGYLWGGSEETSDETINGNESGVGWISMSGTNYGVTIPTDNTAVTGYAWANASNTPNSSVSQEGNGLGWIQFDPVPDDLRYPGCGYPASPCNGVMRNDDNLEGWARFVSIRDALAANNSGGWEGWIKMRGPNYGVQISKMLGVGSGSHTYARSNELGWIDFGQAKYEEPCTLVFVPATKTMNENSSDTVTLEEVSLGTNCNSGVVNLTINNPIVNSLSPISVDFSSPAKETKTITLGIGAVSSTTTYNNAVSASSASSGTANLNLIVQNVPVCTISCPDSVDVISGHTKDFDVTVGGETGCSGIDSCSMAANSYGLSSTKLDGDTCQVTSSSTDRFGSAVSTSYVGAKNCPTTVNIKGPGWVETTP